MERLVEVFTSGYRSRLDALQLKVKANIQAGYSGTRKSRAKGSSLDFSDFREYIAGDDLRRLDWNSYARTDRLFLKLFMEEKQASINIFIDTSKSMDYGDPHKGFYAKQIAASLTYIALSNMDRVNLFAANEHISAQKMGIQTKNLFFESMQFLDQLSWNQETKISKSIKEVSNMQLGTGVSIILSDFFSIDGYEDALKVLQAKKQDIILMQILSPQEINPEWIGALRLVDSENHKYQDIVMSDQVRSQYKKALHHFQGEMKEFCYKRGANFINVITEVPILQFLSRNL